MANWASVQNLGDPSTEEWRQRNLTTVGIPGQTWQVYKGAAPAFQNLLNALVAEGYKPSSSGGYNYRNIRGSNMLSQHAFGTAIDINAGTNALGSRQSDIPNAAALAAKYGLEWGGNWKSRPDPMHFEYQGRTGQLSPLAEPQASQTGQRPGMPQPQPATFNPLQIAQQQPGPSSVMQGLMAPQGDWMQNRSYSTDALMSDFFAGRNPLRRFVYQKIAGLFA